MRPASARKLMVVCAASVGSLGILNASGGSAASAAQGNGKTTQYSSSSFHVSAILEGAALHHTFVPAGATVPETETLSDPDDITRLGGELFVGFQNGVGPQGQASTDGNLDSTVVELSLTGHVIGQWDVGQDGRRHGRRCLGWSDCHGQRRCQFGPLHHPTARAIRCERDHQVQL